MNQYLLTFSRILNSFVFMNEREKRHFSVIGVNLIASDENLYYGRGVF